VQLFLTNRPGQGFQVYLGLSRDQGQERFAFRFPPDDDRLEDPLRGNIQPAGSFERAQFIGRQLEGLVDDLAGFEQPGDVVGFQRDPPGRKGSLRLKTAPPWGRFPAVRSPP
jgi:hypothetical protein